jgi:hypothetical protein
MRYVVIESTPGYMPDDDDPFTTDDYAAAVAHLNELAAGYADDPDGNYEVTYGLASSANLAAVAVADLDKIHDLGRWIAIEIDEDDVQRRSRSPSRVTAGNTRFGFTMIDRGRSTSRRARPERLGLETQLLRPRQPPRRGDLPRRCRGGREAARVARRRLRGRGRGRPEAARAPARRRARGDAGRVAGGRRDRGALPGAHLRQPHTRTEER